MGSQPKVALTGQLDTHGQQLASPQLSAPLSDGSPEPSTCPASLPALPSAVLDKPSDAEMKILVVGSWIKHP